VTARLARFVLLVQKMERSLSCLWPAKATGQERSGT